MINTVALSRKSVYARPQTTANFKAQNTQGLTQPDDLAVRFSATPEEGSDGFFNSMQLMLKNTWNFSTKPKEQITDVIQHTSQEAIISTGQAIRKITNQEMATHLAAFTSDVVLESGNQVLTEKTRQALAKQYIDLLDKTQQPTIEAGNHIVQGIAKQIFTDENRDAAIEYTSKGLQETLSRNKEAAGLALADALQLAGPKLFRDSARYTRRVGLQLYSPIKQMGYGAGVAAGGHYILPLFTPTKASKAVTAGGFGTIGVGLFNLAQALTQPTDHRPERMKQLVLAAQNGDLKTLHRLIAEKVNLNGLDEARCSALYRAAEQGQLATASLLINTGANLQLGSIDQGRTPLWIAAQKGHLALVNLLTDSGAALDMPNENGLTPVRIATLSGHHDVVKALISAGANHSKLAQDTETYKIFRKYQLAVAEAMMLLAQDPEKAHQLFCKAVSKDDYRKVYAFIGAGVDLNKPDRNGWTPLALAASEGHLGMVKALINASPEIDLNKPSVGNWTPLALAANEGYGAIVQLLIDTQKVDLDAKTLDDKTALEYAIENENTELVEMLEKAGAKWSLSRPKKQKQLTDTNKRPTHKNHFGFNTHLSTTALGFRVKSTSQEIVKKAPRSPHDSDVD